MTYNQKVCSLRFIPGLQQQLTNNKNFEVIRYKKQHTVK